MAWRDQRCHAQFLRGYAAHAGTAHSSRRVRAVFRRRPHAPADLGLDEQAMLLRALDEKRFLPAGSARDLQSASHKTAFATICSRD